MHRPHNRFEIFLRLIFIALVVLLVILAALLFIEYRRLREFGPPSMRMHHPSLPVTDSAFVQSWMTYDYVDHIYALPPDYLKTTLSIADSRYPRISIAESAEAQHISAATMTTDVQNAVQNYLLAKGP